MAVGIMSGTSLDGIDVVIASIDGMGKSTRVDLVAFETFPFDPLLKKRIIQALNPISCSLELITSLNMELGYAFGFAAKRLCEKNHIPIDHIAFVSSHGQTIWHINEDDKTHVRSSLQLGDGSAIASIMKTTVITNFRNADIAEGGVGAPLVPYMDYILYRDEEKTRVLHNIGGISNVTVLPKQATEDDVYAFDTGPGNMMIDEAMYLFYQRSYDEDGNIASSGKMIDSLMNELMNHPYLLMEPPKSTGREIFGRLYTHALLNTYQQEKPEDIIHTLSMFTVNSIIHQFKHFILPKHRVDEVIISGGGMHNQFILGELEKRLPEITWLTINQIGGHGDAKEALAFLILGHETLHKQPSNVLKATGAKRKTILGQVTYYHKEEGISWY
ncbi:MAG: anhydro-N-acetylmuramic acid kinase [Acholeplasma sp.]|nr:MAG: anhydro-N-acetylmuramic acid kinase [Acholeplasma sp.]